MHNYDEYKKRFFTIFFISLAIFFIIYIVFTTLYIYNSSFTYDGSLQVNSEIIDKSEEEIEVESTNILTAPLRTNVLIAGVDKNEGLTDAIMVASFISSTGEINVISIPRDTYITFTSESLYNLRKYNRGAPSIMKINSVHSYVGSENGMEVLRDKVEEILGIKINYYVKVNLDAFKSVVDTIGGVYFTVPEGGLRYSDPTQGLYINLKEGYQLLDGDAAEGLVRFRKGYATQDLKRIEVQQEFIKEFIKQALSKETLLKNIGGLAINFIKYVTTDFGLKDIPKYLKVISKIDAQNIETETLPGRPQTIDGISYYIIDKESTKNLVDDFFYGKTEKEPELSQQLQEQNMQQTPKQTTE